MLKHLPEWQVLFSSVKMHHHCLNHIHKLHDQRYINAICHERQNFAVNLRLKLLNCAIKCFV